MEADNLSQGEFPTIDAHGQTLVVSPAKPGAYLLFSYARTAELNSYPGPLHILELKDQLKISTAQVQKIEAAFQEMDAEAKALGQQIIERERSLSADFASNRIEQSSLRTQTQLLAELYGKLRVTHLEAHLKVTPLLSSEQIDKYNILRGYTGSEAHHEHNHRH